MPHPCSNRASPSSAAPAPGHERSSGAAEQEECSSFQSCPTCPAVSVQRAGSAVSWLTLAADAGGQSGLVLSVVAQIVPVLMDQMGAGAPSRPARRRLGLTARAAAPVRAAASSSSGGACSAPWRRSAQRGRSARRADRRVAARWSSPARCPGAAVGGRLLALPFRAGSARRNGPGCGWLARGRPYVLPGCRHRTRNPC
jgi:hypothetical protein